MAAAPAPPAVGDVFDDTVTAALVERVLALGEGARLPSERELGEQLGISRTALRDRLGYLESLGVLQRRVGAGTFVRRLDPEVLSQALTIGLLGADMTMVSLQGVRWALERQAAYEAAVQGDPVSTARMAVALRDMEQTDDPQTSYAADVRFHEALLQASGSPALIFLAEALGNVLNRTLILRPPEEHPAVRHLHREILQAVTDGDGARAMAVVDEHFNWLRDATGTS